MRRIHFSDTLRQAAQAAELSPTRGLLPKGGAGLSHGFVLGRGATYEIAPVADSFSDAVVCVAPNIFYGPLKNTLPWFADSWRGARSESRADGRPFAHTRNVTEEAETTRHESRELVVAALMESVQKAMTDSSPGVAAFGPSLLGSFFYASFRYGQGDSGAFRATHDNIDYRHFLANLTWEAWLGGLLAFLDLGDAPRSQRERQAQDLERFAEQMRTMRFALPTRVPRELSQAEITRRFGTSVAIFWRLWAETLSLGGEPSEGEAELFAKHFRWKNLSTGHNPAHFGAASDALFPHVQGLWLRECAQAVEELVFCASEKVAALSGVGTRYGLADFALTICCPGHRQFTSHHRLVTPIFGRDKVTTAVVRRLVESIQGKKGGHAWEFTDENGTHWRPEWVERIVVTPLALAMEWVRPMTLFEDVAARPTASSLALSFSLREGCKARCHAVPQSLEPGSMAEGSSAPLPYFRYQQSLRPPILLRQRGVPVLPLPRSPVFLESIGGFDYFAVPLGHEKASPKRNEAECAGRDFLPSGGGARGESRRSIRAVCEEASPKRNELRRAENPAYGALWVRSPVEARTSTPRPFELWGLFPRRVPREI